MDAVLGPKAGESTLSRGLVVAKLWHPEEWRNLRGGFRGVGGVLQPGHRFVSFVRAMRSCVGVRRRRDPNTPPQTSGKDALGKDSEGQPVPEGAPAGRRWEVLRHPNTSHRRPAGTREGFGWPKRSRRASLSDAVGRYLGTQIPPADVRQDTLGRGGLNDPDAVGGI